MSKSVIDLAASGNFTKQDRGLRHPAGVWLPFDGARDAEIITPHIRKDIDDGTYSAEMIAMLPEALVRGDRVLVIGTGLGIVATLIAKSGLADRIIAIEPNIELIPYLAKTIRANSVPEVETVHAVLSHRRTGMVPFHIDQDMRNSSLSPRPGTGRRVIQVPMIDLNLILAEERISLIVSDVADIQTSLFTEARLRRVERILMRLTEERLDCWTEGGLCRSLAEAGYRSAPRPGNQAVTIFRRAVPAG